MNDRIVLVLGLGLGWRGIDEIASVGLEEASVDRGMIAMVEGDWFSD